MPLSVRLDPQTEAAVTRLARRRRVTRSAIVREAIAAFDRGQPATDRPWDAIRHLIGVVDSGGAGLSESTGGRFRALVQEKARARRAR